MAQITEGATDSVDAVWFNFMTTEEVRKHSVLKLTNANLLDFMNRPMPGGLYDPVLGPLEDRTPCKSCGLLKLHCPGHCGHIDLVSPIYNPLLFNFLHTLIQRTCFFCYHFRAERTEVEKCISQLKLIGKGDIVGAKRLDTDSKDSSSHPENSEGCQKLGSRLHESEAVNPKEWTSLQLTEAMSVLNKFLKVKYKRCKNCDAKNPAITKPTFGWFHTSGMSGSQMRENVIRGCKMADTFSGEVGSDIEDANDASSSEEGVDITKTKTPEIGFKGADGTSAKACKKAKVPLEFLKQKNLFSGPLLPSEVKKVMKLLWENEIELCSLINCIQQQGFGEKVGYSMFFLETVLVPPIKFRAPTKGGDSVMEHPQTVLLSKVLQANISLGNAHNNDLQSSKVIVRLWMDLQQSINLLFDSKTAMSQRRDVSPGICQLLERKEGMFRQKMMGKRVNFACRSVISPDPYLAVNEIGIPPYFALRLTYPERVTPWNVVKLREAIINGSELHPGATHYVDKLSTQRLPPNRKARISISRKLPSSRAAITQPGKNFDYEFEGKIVLRHLQDGDVVLVNRQPTLHKPSIMAHVVRVLKGEKTIRMHYANCSTYNADFDGDEINVHFPQDEISRAEAYNIVNANNQYVRPSNGEPLRALIQDHIVSAVLLTKRDTFLSRDEFNQLLYSSGVSGLAQHHRLGKSGQKVLISSSEEGMLPILPAILKPKPLWTGKQVITAVLNHITRGRPPFTVEKTGKTPRDFFKNRSNENKLKSGGQEGKDAEENSNKEPDEEKILIYKNDLVRGVIDKAQFADYGLVHTVQELYGSNTAGFLLSVFSRLFTVFLQMHGFTCGVDDLLIMNDKDIERKKQLEECEKKVTEAHYEFCAVKVDTEIAPIELQLKIEKTIRRDGEAALTALDRTMISVLNKNSSQGVLTELLSEGLVKPMGRNCISLMTTTGAKGSKVNFQQISSFLGQQELEGKRVPRMVSGKTLPCFHPWDWAARAGGFISDRFLTGLRPQEYYFHCMAGREGLVDTAVKTSRSGYLQRCLIKNLECLKISYDHTVRDADGSIVQFNYGEDGIDVHQTSFVTKFEALALNCDVMSEKLSSMLGEPYDSGKILPDDLRDKAVQFIKDNRQQKIKTKNFLKLLKLKFLSSLAQPGEPVGVLAAQSVGEPSTQMTLNTFHLAGRGEMNVTLGIPRLQEILMTASIDIKTPVMTCPLHKGKTKEDALRLADKMKKITVAEILESMGVSVTPFAIHNGDICSIYKLKMRLGKPGRYLKNSDITVTDCQHILEVVFLRELEDAIQNHLVLLSRISGIKNFMPDSRPNASSETDEDVPESRSHETENDDDTDDEGRAEDLGLDAQKQKQQATDEMDYEDGSEEEQNEGASLAGLECENDMSEDENGTIENNVIGSDNEKDDIFHGSPNAEDGSKLKSREGNTRTFFCSLFRLFLRWNSEKNNTENVRSRCYRHTKMQSTNGTDLSSKQEQKQQPPPQQPPQWVANQWMGAMQYPTTAAMVMMQQQQMMMYPHHYMAYNNHFQYQQYQQQQGKQQYQQQQQSYSTKQQQHGSNSDEVKTIWVGDLVHWMDESYLHSCFSHTGEVSSVKIIRNKQTGQSEGYGFVEFYSREAAEKVLQSYNGSLMPNTEQPFRLNWASFSVNERRPDSGSDLSIFVGDLAADVTDTMLHETFSSRFQSVKGAKVVIDSNTGRSKGYGFVRFGDENERSRAMTEMNGVYCSSRPMRIGVATPKKASGYQQQYSSQAVVLAGGHASNGAVAQGSQYNNDSNNATIFVGGLDSDVSDDDLRQPFSQFGEIISVKIPPGKGCGFVQFVNRKNAEEAIQSLNGTTIGKQTVRLSWGRNVNKQWRADSGNQWNGGYYQGQVYGGYGYGYAMPSNQDPSMYAAAAIPGAS